MSTKTETHTAGSWKAAHLHPRISGFKITASGGRSVASYSSSSKRPIEEQHANARLIAAAPELLKQLRHLAYACEECAPFILTGEARKAIAIAEGGTE